MATLTVTGTATDEDGNAVMVFNGTIQLVDKPPKPPEPDTTAPSAPGNLQGTAKKD